MKYFTDSIDRPQDVVANPLPLGLLYEEVSTDLLDGFINHCTILSGFALQTDAWPDDLDHHGVVIRDVHNPRLWFTVFPKTYDNAYELLVDPKNYSHPQLHRFRQDVLILGKAKIDPINDESVIYIYFFYGIAGRCDIGRFTTNDSEDQVLAEFSRYVSTPAFGGGSSSYSTSLL